MKSFDNLKNLISSLEGDAKKHSEGNKAAGTRLRKGMMEIKKAAQAIRQEVTDAKNEKA